MKLNNIAPTKGSRKKAKRLGRGIGSGLGKTSGKGHKGQHARAGGYKKVGFEGGQMPLQRRVPKFGFTKTIPNYIALRLSDLSKLSDNEITLAKLVEAGLVDRRFKQVKVYLSGKVERALHLQGIRTTKGAKAAIEAAGGKVSE